MTMEPLPTYLENMLGLVKAVSLRKWLFRREECHSCEFMHLLPNHLCLKSKHSARHTITKSISCSRRKCYKNWTSECVICNILFYQNYSCYLCTIKAYLIRGLGAGRRGSGAFEPGPHLHMFQNLASAGLIGSSSAARSNYRYIPVLI